MGRQQIPRENTTHERAKSLAPPHPHPQEGDRKAARNRQDGITKTNIKHKQQKRIHRRNTALERPVNSRVQRVKAA